MRIELQEIEILVCSNDYVNVFAMYGCNYLFKIFNRFFFICAWDSVNFTYNCRFTINRGFNENRLKFPFFKNFKIMTSDKGKLFRIDMATPPLRLLWLLWIKVYPGI